MVLERATDGGTIDPAVLPILAKCGLPASVDFFLVCSPEREGPADSDYTTGTISKIGGGVTANW